MGPQNNQNIENESVNFKLKFCLLINHNTKKEDRRWKLYVTKNYLAEDRDTNKQ